MYHLNHYNLFRQNQYSSRNQYQKKNESEKGRDKARPHYIILPKLAAYNLILVEKCH